MYFIKIKNFCAKNNTIKIVKGQHNMRRYVGSHISNEGLLCIIHKEFLQLKTRDNSIKTLKILINIPSEKIHENQ
jgi:hypothetical protein